MARLLSIDYGRKRCGIAVTDVLQIIPGGLCTVPTGELMRFLSDYFQREDVSSVVLGLPVQTNGAPSENQARVRTFAAHFRKQFPHIPLHFYDERFTSKLAHQAMLESGMPRMKRRDKALVDEISACIILQDFMQSRAATL
ncbi:MAG: Holliday junction resolvase RuvX [Bacteroidaceae bacterium]|nr:Holliday junction resolvase RuvX [Bacteroidaceae bacterium]